MTRLRATRLIAHDHVLYDAGVAFDVPRESALPLLACGAAVVAEGALTPSDTEIAPGAEAPGAMGAGPGIPAPAPPAGASSPDAPAGPDAQPLESDGSAAGAAEGKAAPARRRKR